MITPDPSSERADLPADYYEWGEELQAIADRSWITAEMLYVRTLEKTSERQISMPAELKQDTVERIYRTLGGVSQAIEGELPRSLRRRNECYFRMTIEPTGVVRGYWESANEDRSVDLRREIKHRAALLGELPEEIADLVTEVTIEEIFHGDLTLPGFRRSEESTPQTVWLKLLPRITET